LGGALRRRASKTVWETVTESPVPVVVCV
jgi:hypothetical protein